ncbi:hypothetical protein EV189_3770 [Motilibacter rhizosphaerae]|uniref:Uncharacterized protein n=1 Tax=Motilibacter rhizosphaerae TaxID=598652 RepID=A0A4V2F2R9_9ACTN|nr:hypothetical protein EV189_3770 [Motilibacter rhizosphaerae]
MLVLAAAGCRPAEQPSLGEACAALDQVAASASAGAAAVASYAGGPDEVGGSLARRVLAGSVQEDVESAREMTVQRPRALPALAAGDAAAAAVRSGPLDAARAALERARSTTSAARAALGCPPAAGWSTTRSTG